MRRGGKWGDWGTPKRATPPPGSGEELIDMMKQDQRLRRTSPSQHLARFLMTVVAFLAVFITMSTCAVMSLGTVPLSRLGLDTRVGGLISLVVAVIVVITLSRQARQDFWKLIRKGLIALAVIACVVAVVIVIALIVVQTTATPNRTKTTAPIEAQAEKRDPKLQEALDLLASLELETDVLDVARILQSPEILTARFVFGPLPDDNVINVDSAGDTLTFTVNSRHREESLEGLSPHLAATMWSRLEGQGDDLYPNSRDGCLHAQAHALRIASVVWDELGPPTAQTHLELGLELIYTLWLDGSLEETIFAHFPGCDHLR